jgi:predicted RNase H-like HicB family nuclease
LLNLKYTLIIEATKDPNFFGFYSPELEGFSGVGNSIEDCVYKGIWGMEEHLELAAENKIPIPNVNPNAKIIIQNEQSLKSAA